MIFTPGLLPGINVVTVFNPGGVAQKIMHVPPFWGRTCNNFTPSLLPGATQVKSPIGLMIYKYFRTLFP